MVKTVESALQVNILKISKAIRQSHSNIFKLEWVVGSVSHVGVGLLTESMLVVSVHGHVLKALVSWREFRKDRFQPHIQCLACGKLCHVLYVEGNSLQCRRCAGLIYECQRGHARERALLKAQKITAQLNGKPHDLVPARPPGMWRKTYLRRVRKLVHAQRAFYNAAIQTLKAVNGQPRD